MLSQDDEDVVLHSQGPAFELCDGVGSVWLLRFHNYVNLKHTLFAFLS